VHLEPIRDEIINLDRFSFLFLIVGLFGTTFLGLILWFMLGIYAFILIVITYLIALGAVYYRNYLQQQTLTQSLMLNMAILIYVANQSIFF
jgi:hypothetical protein